MTGVRRPTAALVADGLHALAVALDSSGITLAAERVDDGPLDTVLDVLVDDRPLTVGVEVKAYCTGAAARQAIAAHRGPGAGWLPLLVADRITTEARELLTAAGWSWLDRRGRLHLRGPAIRVDTDVPALGASTSAQAGPAISGRGGITVAYSLLAHPDRSLSPNRDAPTLRLAPSTISIAVRRLADAGLVDDQRRAIVPELFWELAAAWRADRTWLVVPPDPQRHRPPDPWAPTWRRTGSIAAAAWGAPVVTVPTGPVELYVRGQVEVSIAQRRYGAAEPGAGAAVLVVAPAAPVVAAVGDDHGIPILDGWPAAPKLAVALDLAQDRTRGREILADWADDDAVWR